MITIATNSCERLPCVYLYVLTTGHRQPRVGPHTHRWRGATRNAGPGNPRRCWRPRIDSASRSTNRARSTRVKHRIGPSFGTLYGWNGVRDKRFSLRLSPGPFCKTRRRKQIGDDRERVELELGEQRRAKVKVLTRKRIRK